LLLRFQRRPWDLYVSFAYTFLMSSILIGTGGGNLFAVVLILFVPGYVLVAALFPGENELDWIERVALAFGLSIAVVPLLGFALNFTPLGIGLAPIVLTIALFTVMIGLVAHWRRMRLPLEERLSASLNLTIPKWGEYSSLDRALTLILVSSMVLAIVTVVYVAIAPRPSEGFTQFYLLGSSGNASSSSYPFRLNVSELATLFIGIANHEAANENYSVRVDLVGVLLVYNMTAGVNETVEHNRTTWSWFNVSVANGQNWSQPYAFRINTTGLWKVQFLLFKNGDLYSAYRETHLFVRVQ